MTPTLSRPAARIPLRDLESFLDELRTEVRRSAAEYRTDTRLTDEGRADWLGSSNIHHKRAARLEHIAKRMADALDAAEARAGELRDAMTRPAGSVEEQTLAELRYARRADRIRADLVANPLAAADLVRDADPLDVPVILEAVRDIVGTEGSAGRAAASPVESALRDRSPDYATAADVAAKVPVARRFVAAKVDDAVEAMTNVHAPEHVWGSLANRSIAACGEAISSLSG